MHAQLLLVTKTSEHTTHSYCMARSVIKRKSGTYSLCMSFAGILNHYKKCGLRPTTDVKRPEAVLYKESCVE